MKGHWKRCLVQYLSSKPSLNRKAVNLKRSYDEVYKMVQKLGGAGAPPKKK